MFSTALQTAALEYKLELTPLQFEQFKQYNDILLEWNNKMNLTAITEPEQVAIKHMIDSLSCYCPNVFKDGAKIIDVGTGAGFPGLPLKIFKPTLQLTLLDSLNKRVNFLRCVAETLNLPAVVLIHSRAETGGRDKLYREQFDVAVSRAVARLNVLTELCLPFVKLGGYFVALKGAQYQAEAAEAKRAIAILGGVIERIIPVKLPGIADVRAVIYIKKIKLTPLIYPRQAGTPEKCPL